MEGVDEVGGRDASGLSLRFLGSDALDSGV